MNSWQDLTADQVTELLEGGLDANIDGLGPNPDGDAEDAAFLSQLLHELEGDNTDDPLDGLDTAALPDAEASEEEDYWLPDGDVATRPDKQPTTAGRRQPAGRSTRQGPIQNGSAPSTKRKWSPTTNRQQLAHLIRSGKMPANRIKSALARGRTKLNISMQRSQRVKDSFLLHPSEQARAQEAAAGSSQGAAVSKPEVVRRTRSNLEQVEHLRNKANAAKSDWGQAEERLKMLTQGRSDDGERIAQQKQIMLQAGATLTAANSELLTAQVRYTRRKLPAGRFYMFKEGKKEQGPFSARQLIKLARQLGLSNKTEVLVDSSMLNEGTMWVYLDVLLPLLEYTGNLVNITPVPNHHQSRPPLHTPGHANDAGAPRGDRQSLERRGNQGNNGAGRDQGGGCGDGRGWGGTGPSMHRGNDQPGLVRREDAGRWNDSGARPRVNSAADVQRNAHHQKRVQQQKKYEEENALFEEELSLETYTLETKDGEMWGPHSYDALTHLVERKEIFQEVELMYDTEYGVSTISYVDLNQRMKERREKVQRLKQYANDAAQQASPEKLMANGNGRERYSSPTPPAAGRRPETSRPETSTVGPEPSLRATDGLSNNGSMQQDALPGPPPKQATVATPLASGTSASASSSGEAPLLPAAMGNAPHGVQTSSGQLHEQGPQPGTDAPMQQMDQGTVHGGASEAPHSATFQPGGSNFSSTGLPSVLPPLPAPGSSAMPTAPVGTETLQACPPAFDGPPGPQQMHNPPPPFSAPQQPPGYGVPEMQAPAHHPGMPMQHQAQLPHPSQLPLPAPPIEMEEVEPEIENMRFGSLEELLGHVQENEMDHPYQVCLQKFGQQRPTRMGKLDVMALIAYKDAPLHIAEQALREFVRDPQEPVDASEAFRRLLGQ